MYRIIIFVIKVYDLILKYVIKNELILNDVIWNGFVKYVVIDYIKIYGK